MNRPVMILQELLDGLIVNFGAAVAALLIGVLLYKALFAVMGRLANRADIPLSPIFVARMRPPLTPFPAALGTHVRHPLALDSARTARSRAASLQSLLHRTHHLAVH